MKLAISGIALYALTVSPVTSAQAETCSGRAQTCVIKWGSPRAACFEQFRLAACEKTGKYVAPNGNVWPANRTQRKTNVES
jgi:putative component of membrane protein insertase Oxa1/YidC/SpoIIIJ protein YidD